VQSLDGVRLGVDWVETEAKTDDKKIFRQSQSARSAFPEAWTGGWGPFGIKNLHKFFSPQLLQIFAKPN
jgi:hypothetical protein